MRAPTYLNPTKRPGDVYVTSPNEANIRAAIALAFAAGGGAVYLPAGIVTLTQSLPLLSGVAVIGSPAEYLNFPATVADAGNDLTGGTILKPATGYEGLFPAFRPGLSDSSWFVDETPLYPNTTDTSADTVTLKFDHNLPNGTKCSVDRDGGGLVASTAGVQTFYYLRKVSASVYSLHTTQAGAIANTGKVDLTGSITSTIRIYRNPFGTSSYTTTTNGTTSVVLAGGKGVEFLVGEPFVFLSSVTNITAGQTYYILSISTDTITVGATPTGSAIAVGAGNPALTPNGGFVVVNSRLEDIAFDAGASGVGFSSAVSAGGFNQQGLFFGQLRNLIVKYTSDWGINLQNPTHLECKRIWTYGCASGFNLSANCSAGWQPGNSVLEHIYDCPTNIPSSTTAKLNLHRGILLGAFGSSSNLNEIQASRVQANFFARSRTTYIAASQSGSGFTLAAGKGAEFQVGMPVRFTAAGGNGNIALGQVYFVRSVNGDTLTVSKNRQGTDNGGTFASAPTITTCGYGQLEIIGVGTSTTCSNMTITNVDCEGVTDGALNLEKCGGVYLVLNEVEASSVPHVVLRAAQPNTIQSFGNFSTDIDGSSVKSYLFGYRDYTNSYQYTGRGMGDNVITSKAFLNIGSRGLGSNFAGQSDFEQMTPSGGNFVRSINGFAQRIYGDTGAPYSMTGGNAGVSRISGGGVSTATLPAIDATNIGVEYTLLNNNSGIITVSTSSSQLINGLAGHTQVTLAAATGTVLAWARFKAMCNDPGNPSSYYWFVEFGPGAAIV